MSAAGRSQLTELVLIEDDAGDALLAQELLSEIDPTLKVLWVRSLTEAHEVLSSGTQCVLLDLGLPDASGLEALFHVVQAAPGAAVLVLTGLADDDSGLQAVANGAQDYLVKDGLDVARLRRAIRYATERKRSQETQLELTASELRAQENSRLERGLLPVPVLHDPTVSVTARYRPGRRRALLGGDFYDVVELPDGTLNVLIGDVCGHGPDEAALGVCLRMAWRTLVLSGISADRRFPLVSQVLAHESRGEEMFATCCMVVVHSSRRSALLYLAGHPAPILLGHGQLSDAEVGPPLGLETGQGWDPVEVELPEGFAMLAFTDGLVEGMDSRTGDRLGVPALLSLLLDPEVGVARDRSWPDRLITVVEERNGGPLIDDLALLVLTSRPADG